MDGPGEAELAADVARVGRELGFAVSIDEVLPGRPNVAISVPPTTHVVGTARRLLFDLHLDTVPHRGIAGATVPRIVDNRMYGRGTCDTKGALAAAIVAASRVAARRIQRSGEILLLFTVDEEYLKRGVAHAVDNGLTATAAIVGEPTSLRPIVAHKGAVRFRIVTHGRSAHTSQPENGDNAILQMVDVIEWLRERLEPAIAVRHHPRLTPPTMTIGTITGGTGVNIVPDRCMIEIDRRTLPTEDPRAILAEYDAVLADLMRTRPGIKATREEPYLVERGLDGPADGPLVRAIQDAIRAECGDAIDVTPTGVPYGTDASLVWGRTGTPTVVLGPGDIAQAHTADEWVDLREVQRCVAIYEHVMTSFVSGEWGNGA
jgi:acetylornithine deacetylase